ncbi:MAG: hypothetical protein JNK60_04435 [Acidobacteria bacterium]|nr:hypothetical protein [Acidobacteriota bacterium]
MHGYTPSRPIASALLLSALVLAVTADERRFDASAATRTAFALVRGDGLSLSRSGQGVNPRPSGDAVMTGGAGLAFFRTLPAALAAPLETATSPGAAQTLFVLQQLLCVLLAAFSASALAARWGGDVNARRRALFATALASPLWPALARDGPEPLLAALTGCAFAFAVLSRTQGPLPAAVAGFFAGLAVFVGDAVYGLLFLAVVATSALGGRSLRGTPIGTDDSSMIRKRRLWKPGQKGPRWLPNTLAAVLGFLPGGVLFTVLEVLRFGRPFGGPPALRRPLAEGLVETAFAFSGGLLFTFPLVVLAVAGAIWLAQKQHASTLPAALFCLALLVVAALTNGAALLPAVPVLAAFAALAAVSFAPFVARVLFAASVVVNVDAVMRPALTLSPFRLPHLGMSLFGKNDGTPQVLRDAAADAERLAAERKAP